jgi:hypothetical protein
LYAHGHIRYARAIGDAAANFALDRRRRLAALVLYLADGLGNFSGI